MAKSRNENAHKLPQIDNKTDIKKHEDVEKLAKFMQFFSSPITRVC